MQNPSCLTQGARQGEAGGARLGVVGFDAALSGSVRQVRRRVVSCGLVGYGKAGTVWAGELWLGPFR